MKTKITPLFPLILIFADLVFIALHSIRFFTPLLDNPLFSIEKDGGYSEIYQYLKWFSVIILLVYISYLRRSYSYLAWGLVFTYLLCDDALKIHERVGTYVARNLTLTPPLGLRLQDLGELSVSAAAVIILLIPVAWAYLYGSPAFKKMTHNMLLLILALTFFGVVVDMAHVAIQLGWRIKFALGVIEDGGEMLIASFILWYVFLLSVYDEKSKANLYDG